MKGSRWEKVSEEGKQLVTCLLQVDPEKRLSAKEILEARWFTEDGETVNFEVLWGTCGNFENGQSTLRYFQVLSGTSRYFEAFLGTFGYFWILLDTFG